MPAGAAATSKDTAKTAGKKLPAAAAKPKPKGKAAKGAKAKSADSDDSGSETETDMPEPTAKAAKKSMTTAERNKMLNAARLAAEAAIDKRRMAEDLRRAAEMLQRS
eukprot:13235-Heterococcus_DN1.PRE.2